MKTVRMNFISGKELSDCIFNLIDESEEQLTILLPLVNLNEDLKNQFLKTQLNNYKVHITVGFGYNPLNIDDECKNQFIKFFSQFPSITLIYVPELTDEYYNNQVKSVISSTDSLNSSYSKKATSGLCLNKFKSKQTDLYQSTMDKHINYLREKGQTVLIKKPRFKKKFLGFYNTYDCSVEELNLLDQLSIGSQFTQCNYTNQSEIYFQL